MTDVLSSVNIAAVGCTKVGEHYERSLRCLAAESVLSCMRNAPDGLIPEALFASSFASDMLVSQSAIGPLIVDAAGLPKNIPAFRVEGACASGALAFHQAVISLAAGRFDTVMATGVEKMTDSTPARTTMALASASDMEHEGHHGATFSALNSMFASAYQKEYGVTSEQFALFPVNSHENAVTNDYAQLRNRITVKDVVSSQMVCPPLRLLECCPISDGACSILLTTKNLNGSPDGGVRVKGLGCATDTLSIADRKCLTSLPASRIAARKALTDAGMKDVSGIDVLEVHDAFSIMGILALEDLGFAEEGKACEFLESGGIKRDGGIIPTNTFGGLKARGHPVGATGLYQIAELFWQLKGAAGENQVKNARTGMAQSIGGVGSIVAATILGSEE